MGHLVRPPQIITGLVVGVILGLVARAMPVAADGNENWLVGTVHTIGSSYVKLLTVAVIPLVFTAIVSSIANLREVANAARLAVQTLLWFAITAFIAVVIGIVIGLVTQPGSHTTVTGAGKEPATTGSWWAFVTGLVPSNFLGLNAKTTLTEGAASTSLSFNVLQLLVVAAAIGIAALKVGAKAEPFLQFNASLLAIVQKVLWWIIRLAPIGTAALIANAVATYGWDAIGSLGWFTAAVYIGLAVVFLVVYPVLIRAHGLSVRAFYSGVWPATQLGFVSRSSIGTLPLTERVTERNLGVPPRVRVVRGAARVDHQDGRLRCHLSRDRRDLRRRVLRCAFVVHRLPADHRGLRDRIRGHRGHHRRDGHAHAHAVDAGTAPRRGGPAARRRTDRRHGPHRGQRHRPGSRPDDRREAGSILDEARYNAERTGDPFQDDEPVAAK